MVKRKRLLTGSSSTGRWEPEQNQRREPDFEYLAGTWEWAGQWVTGPEGCIGLERRRFQRINNQTPPFLSILIQIVSLRLQSKKVIEYPSAFRVDKIF